MSTTHTFTWAQVRGLCLDPSHAEYDVTAVSDAITPLIVLAGDEEFSEHVAEATTREDHCRRAFDEEGTGWLSLAFDMLQR